MTGSESWLRQMELAATFIGALAHPEDQDELEVFLRAVSVWIAGNQLNRKTRGALNRATRLVYEARMPAAAVANQTSMAVTSTLSQNLSIRLSVADNLTVSKVATTMVHRFPKYKNVNNFLARAWKPSKPVVHLAIAFKHALSGIGRGIREANRWGMDEYDIARLWRMPVALVCCNLREEAHAVPLVAMVWNSGWIDKAIRNAQFHLELLRKYIPDLGPSIEISVGQLCPNALMTRQLVQDMRYLKRRPGNAEFQALADSEEESQ